MSTPFIAGFASFVGSYFRTADPQKVKEAINKFATQGVVTNAKTTANNLPYDDLAAIGKEFRERLKFLGGKN